MASRAVQALEDVRTRVRRCISVPLSDVEALKICFTCATVESDALLELSHTRTVQLEANANSHALAISSNEFATLLHDSAFSASRKFNLTNALADDEKDSARQAQRDAVQDALKLTLREQVQRELWESNPRVRMRVLLAVLRKDDHIACLEHALGQVLKSDHRLIDDLRCTTEEEGIDIMSVASLISTTCTNIGT